MSYKIDFFDAFECTGGGCNNSCCCGWKISIDKGTYDFYQNQCGTFAEYVKENIEQSGEDFYVKLTDKKACPFLDDNRLCRIYKEYGPEHQASTCQIFPRSFRIKNGKTTFSLFRHGCEVVLRGIFQHNGPIYLIQDTDDVDLLSEKRLAEFMSFSMDLLQEESISLGAALGTVLYLCLEQTSKIKDNKGILEIPNENKVFDILNEFASVQHSMPKEELEGAAWEVVFLIVDTFCNVIEETGLRAKDMIVWDEPVFQMSDQERKHYLKTAWMKNRDHSSDAMRAKRRLYASFIAMCLMLYNKPGFDKFILGRVCYYIILSEVLPCVWNMEEGQYFSKMAELERVFENSTLMTKYIDTIIQEFLHPDILTYILAFIFLFNTVE